MSRAQKRRLSRAQESKVRKVKEHRRERGDCQELKKEEKVKEHRRERGEGQELKRVK